MNRLTEILSQYTAAKAKADTDLTTLDRSVRGAWTTTVNKAKVEATKLRKEYAVEMFRTAQVVFVPAGAIAVTPGVLVDATKLYSDIADSIMPSVPAKGTSWGITQTHLMRMKIQAIMASVELDELALADQIKPVPLTDRTSVYNRVRDLVRASAGDVFNRVYLEKQAVDQALEAGLTEVVVMITNAQEDERVGLAAAYSRPYLVSTGTQHHTPEHVGSDVVVTEKEKKVKIKPVKPKKNESQDPNHNQNHNEE